MTRRRKYSREFKVQAVQMVTNQGLSVFEVARDLGIHSTLRQKWKKQFSELADQAFPGNGRLPAEQEELRQLRTEVRKLRMERDIKKKRRPSLPGKANELCLHPATSSSLAHRIDVPSTRSLMQWLLRLDDETRKSTGATQSTVHQDDPNRARRVTTNVRQPTSASRFVSVGLSL